MPLKNIKLHLNVTRTCKYGNDHNIAMMYKTSSEFLQEHASMVKIIK